MKESSRLNPNIVKEVGSLVYLEFLNHNANRSQDEVVQMLKGYEVLSEIAGLKDGQEPSEFGAWFVSLVTHVGNNARQGLATNSSEPIFDKVKRRMGHGGNSYEEKSKTEFAITFPDVIQSIVNHPELEQPEEILTTLEREGAILNNAFRYNYMLVRQLRTLGNAIAQIGK